MVEIDRSLGLSALDAAVSDFFELGEYDRSLGADSLYLNQLANILLAEISK